MLRWSHHVDIFGTLHFLCDASQIGRRDTYIHTYIIIIIIIIIIIMRQDHQLPAQCGLHVVVSSSINKHTYMQTSVHTYRA